MAFKAQSYVGGTLHHFDSQLVAYEHTKAKAGFFAAKPINSIVFLNGLFGTLFSVAYVRTIAAALQPNWRLVEPELSTARLGFGVGSVETDAAEIAQLVAYLQNIRPGGRVVLLGHSTGCQDALFYASASLTERDRKAGRTARPRVNGIVLQAPVSDRTAMEHLGKPEDLAEASRQAAQLVAEGRENDVLPRRLTGSLGHAPVSARRWLSLASPGPKHEGQDDMFSHDLPAERLTASFGAVDEGVRIMVVPCGADQYVPDHVSQVELCKRWENAAAAGKGTWDEASGILDGADHALDHCDKKAVDEFIKRLNGFLERVASS